MRWSLLFLMCGAIVACGVEAPVDYVAPSSGAPAVARWTVLLDRALPAREEAETRTAARAWELATAERCPVVFSFDVADVGDELPAQGFVTVRVDYALRSGGWAEWHDGKGSRVIVEVGLDDDALHVTLRHELGHAIGIAGHDQGVMRGGSAITLGDVEALCSVIHPR